MQKARSPPEDTTCLLNKFEKLNARERIPCSRDAWYAMYRRFFWLLDRARK